MRNWTLADRQRQSMLIKQWQPWKRSTGAKTAEGKAISSRNAYKGGFRSQLNAIKKQLLEYKTYLDAL